MVDCSNKTCFKLTNIRLNYYMQFLFLLMAGVDPFNTLCE